MTLHSKLIVGDGAICNDQYLTYTDTQIYKIYRTAMWLISDNNVDHVRRWNG